MCRSIRPLFNFEPPATEEEIRAAALQFVRKISGFAHPSRANEPAFALAVEEISADARRLIGALQTNQQPRDREVEAAKARRDLPSGGLRWGNGKRAAFRRASRISASAPGSRRGSRRSRAGSCGRASRPRHISPAAGRAGTSKSARPSCSTCITERQVSRPMKSASCSGPIGWLAPSRIAVSIDSTEPTPS